MEDKEKKIGFIIAALEEHLPILVHKVLDEFYSPESAGKIGKGLAEYYKALRDGGIPEGCAVEMVQSYASNLTFKGMGHMCRHMSPMGMMGMRPMMGPWMKKYAKKMWHEGKDEEPEEEEES
jgi:hypothetical protein